MASDRATRPPRDKSRRTESPGRLFAAGFSRSSSAYPRGCAGRGGVAVDGCVPMSMSMCRVEAAPTAATPSRAQVFCADQIAFWLSGSRVARPDSPARWRSAPPPPSARNGLTRRNPQTPPGRTMPRDSPLGRAERGEDRVGLLAGDKASAGTAPRTPPPGGEGQGWGANDRVSGRVKISRHLRRGPTQRRVRRLCAPHPFPSPRGGGVFAPFVVRQRNRAATFSREGTREDALQAPAFMMRALSRFQSRFFSVSRLSCSFLPRPSPSSTLARPLSLK
jgi:hypothetical protein